MQRTRHAHGMTLIELMIVISIITIVVALAVPNLLSAKSAANETSAIGSLRGIVSIEAAFRQNDADRNTVSDYWTADLSGLYRVESQVLVGTGIAMIDPALASADDAKESPAGIPGALVPGTAVTAAGLIPMLRTAGKSGYLFQTMAAYRTDPDNNGQPWTNTSTYGFQARPEDYATSGRNTYIMSDAGVSYSLDFGNNAAINGAAWPAANPTTVGWKPVQ